LPVVLLLALGPALPGMARKNQVFEIRALAGASVQVGYDWPEFSFGGGGRLWYYMKQGTKNFENLGFCFDFEYRHRGGTWRKLGYLDAAVQYTIGKPFYLSSGFYLGPCIIGGAGFDLGVTFSLGYSFPSTSASSFILGFEFKTGLVDTWGTSKNISWGVTAGFTV
jgi:hypothetical protein